MARARRRILVLTRTTMAFAAAALVSAQMLGSAPLASAGALDLADPNLLIVSADADPLWGDILPVMRESVAAYPVAGPMGPEAPVPGDEPPLAASVEAHRRADGSLNPHDRPGADGLSDAQLALVRLATSVPAAALAVGQNEGVARPDAVGTPDDSYDVLAWRAQLDEVAAGTAPGLVQSDGYALTDADLARAIAHARSVVIANKWLYNQRWLNRWDLMRSLGFEAAADTEQASGFLVRVDDEGGVATPAATDCEALWSPIEIEGSSIPTLPASAVCSPIAQPAADATPVQGSFGSGEFCTGPGRYTVCDGSPALEDYAGSREVLIPSENVTTPPDPTDAPAATPVPVPGDPQASIGTAPDADALALRADLAAASADLATAQRSLSRLETLRAATSEASTVAGIDRLMDNAKTQIADLQVRITSLEAEIAALGR